MGNFYSTELLVFRQDSSCGRSELVLYEPTVLKPKDCGDNDSCWLLKLCYFCMF